MAPNDGVSSSSGSAHGQQPQRIAGQFLPPCSAVVQTHKVFSSRGDFLTHSLYPTVLPAKSDSDVMFCLQSYQGLMID